MTLRQDLSKGNYRPVIQIPSDGMANPERPSPTNPGVSLLDVVSLVDQTGNAIGVPGNTLAVDATFGGTVETSAQANSSVQSFPENSVNPLQADLAGNLRVNLSTPLPAGSNLIGNVSITAMPAITAVTQAVANGAIQDFANGTSNPIQADNQGALKVNIVAGGASSDFAGPTGNTVPTYASYTGFEDLSGNLVGVSNSTPFPVTVTNVVASSQDGTWTVGLDSGSNTIGNVNLNSGSNTIGNININAGSNAIGSITNTEFGISGSLPAGTNNIGTVTLASGSGTIGAVTIAAGSNAIGSITNTEFGISGSLPAGSNAIGSVTLGAAIPVGSNVIGKVSIDQSTPGTSNFVSAGQNGSWNVGLEAGTNFIGSINNTGFNITSAIPSGSNNIGVVGVQQGVGTSGTYGQLIQGAVTTSSPTYSDGLIQPISLDTSGNLRVNVVAGGGSGANIGLVGNTAPTSAAYIAYANAGGILTGVTPSNPLPVSATFSGTITSVSEAVANSTTQSFADGSTNPLQADLTGALKVNVVDGAVSLAAGSNAIGSITNTEFGISGSLPTGSNAIGSITNTEFGISGSLPTGSNAIGSITNTEFGISGSLPAGANAIGSITNTEFGASQSGLWNVGITNSVTLAANSTVVLSEGANAIGSITNTEFGASQSGLWNVGITNSVTLAANSTVVLSEGANAIGSITNTEFGISGSLPTGSNAIGSITNTEFGISGSLPTGSNAIGSITNTEFGISGSLPTGANAIGSITNTEFGASQSGLWNVGITNSVTLAANSTVVLSEGANAIGSITNTEFGASQSGLWNVGINNSVTLAANSTVVLSEGANAIGSITNTEFGISGSLPTGANAIGSITNTEFGASQSGLWNVGINNSVTLAANSTVVLSAGSNAIGSINNTSFGISGSLPTGSNAIGSITNTGFSINGSLPTGANAIGSITNSSFGASQTGLWNVGINNSVTLAANSTVVLSAGSNAIGSINNTSFGISGSLPTGSNAIGSITNTGFSINGSLPTGANAIGSITNTSFGASQTGLWNVGINNSVTLAANSTVVLSAGSNAIGSINNTSFGISGSLPTGANAIGSITNTSFGISSGTANIGVTGVAQGSTTSGVYGNLTQGAVTTASPTYTTGQISPLSLDTNGNLRVTGSFSSTTTAVANAATQSFANGTSNALQADLTGALKVNVVSGGQNIGVIGNTAPTSTAYIGYANSGGILTGVTTSTPLPTQIYDVTSTGTIQAISQTVVVATNSQDAIGFQVTGTFTGSIIVEGSIDGTNYSTTTFINLTSSGTTTFAIPIIGQINCVGLAYIRFRSYAWTSGTANFTINTSAGALLPPVYNIMQYETFTAISQTAVVSSTLSTIGFQVTGTFTGTIAVEASVDGTNYLATTYVALTTGNSAASFTAPTIGQVNSVGLRYIRFRTTAWTSGTAFLTVVSVAGVSNVTLDNPLPAGTNNIGTVGYVQNSTTSTQYGTLIQGAVTTAAPTYTSGQTSPLSLDTSGLLRVNVVSGGGSTTATANSVTQSFANGTSNPIQADLTGGLKIVGTAANAATTAGNPVLIGATNGTNTYTLSSNTAGQLLTATRSSQIQVNPTITSGSAYAAGNCVGGKLTFASALGAQLSGTLQNITIASKSVQTAGFKLYLFSTNPTNTTFTDKAAVSLNAADLPYLMDIIPIQYYDSGLGTMTIYPVDGAGRTLVGATTSLYGVLVTTGTPTFTSTTDLYITLTIMQD